MKSPLLLVLLLCSLTSLIAQGWSYPWAVGIGTSDNEDEPFVATSPSGDVYVAFMYRNALTLGSDTYPDPIDEGRDIVVVKYDADGVLQWSNVVAGGGMVDNNQFGDIVTGLAADDTGVYLLGFNGRAPDIFGGGTNPDFDMLIAKLNADGSYAWNLGTNGRGITKVFSKAIISPTGKLWVTGIYIHNGNVLEVGGTALPQNGGFILEIDPSTGSIGRTYDGLPFRIDQLTAWTEDRIVATAYYDGKQQIAMIDLANKELLWHHVATDLTRDPRSRALGVFVNQDREIEYLFKTGASRILDFDNGTTIEAGFNYMGVMMVLDSTGQGKRTKRLFTSFQAPQNFMDTFNLGRANYTPVQAVRDDSGNFYLGGTIEKQAVMADGSIIRTDDALIGGPGSKDAVVMKLNADFEAIEFAGDTGSAGQLGEDIALLPGGDVILVGLHRAQNIRGFRDTTQFGSNNLGLSRGGPEDVFVARVRTGAFEMGSSSTVELSLVDRLFPNPAENTLILEFDDPFVGKIQLIDALGRPVQSHEVRQPVQRWLFDVQALPTGQYYCSLLNAQGRQTVPLTVAR